MAKADKRTVAKTGRKKRLGGSVKAADETIVCPHHARSAVLDRLYAIVESRRAADPAISHSAKLLSRGTAKVAQKLGEEAVECVIEAVAGNRDALIAESADVLYHLIVVWVSAGIVADDVWGELIRREGVSGIAEKASRARPLTMRSEVGTSKIP